MVALVRHLAEVMADDERSAIAAALIGAAEREPTLRRLHRRFSDRRRRALVVALEEAGARDPELTAMALAGAVVYARMMGGPPFEPVQAEALVAAVLGPASVSDR